MNQNVHIVVMILALVISPALAVVMTLILVVIVTPAIIVTLIVVMNPMIRVMNGVVVIPWINVDCSSVVFLIIFMSMTSNVNSADS